MPRDRSRCCCHAPQRCLSAPGLSHAPTPNPYITDVAPSLSVQRQCHIPAPVVDARGRHSANSCECRSQRPAPSPVAPALCPAQRPLRSCPTTCTPHSAPGTPSHSSSCAAAAPWPHALPYPQGHPSVSPHGGHAAQGGGLKHRNRLSSSCHLPLLQLPLLLLLILPLPLLLLQLPILLILIKIMPQLLTSCSGPAAAATWRAGLG